MNHDEKLEKISREIAELMAAERQPPMVAESEPLASGHPWVIGDPLLVRTATHILTGRLIEVYANELILMEAAWIADTGRFADAVLSGEFEEVEPFPAERRVVVGRGAIIDTVSIPQLPREQK